MKLIIALSCLLVVAFANENANVLRADSEVNVDSFKYVVELDNSVKIEQQGQLKEPETWVVTGQSSHTSPEGVAVSTQYVADEFGYKVLASDPPLPTPHPIPDYILKSIEYIEKHPSPEVNH